LSQEGWLAKLTFIIILSVTGRMAGQVNLYYYSFSPGKDGWPS
jgi:hypothetical protein